MRKVIFSSDLHARPDEPERIECFRQFINKIAVSSDRLYILGDLFEFGFVFQDRILPSYEPLVEEITGLIRKGLVVYFLAGNHDLWMSQYLRKRGLRIVLEGEIHELFGTKVQFFHGILREEDVLSRFAWQVMNNPTAVWIYSLLPYRMGFNLALKIAQLSRKRNLDFRAKFSVQRLKTTDSEAEVIISGHHHHPCKFSYDAKDFYIIGDWISHFTYLEMTSQGLRLKTFRR
ncbi:UDP-2,3-diacylglucosamine diphosphatase [candidate division WOR-3 bacterium]|nr:UDP-2,3-diacylglucosamine diphosphatase [candidate division WOR-3 bacterium]